MGSIKLSPSEVVAVGHTAGPWRCNERYEPISAVIGADGFEVAELPGTAMNPSWFKKHPRKHWSSDPKSHRERPDDELNANAHLIAAAPDLLEACRAAFEWFTGNGVVHEKLRKVIAKAEGR